MNIQIIANSQISFSSMGGSDKIFIELARCWLRMGFDVRIFCCREAKSMCERSGLQHVVRQVSAFDVERIGLLGAYALRTINSLLSSQQAVSGILYSSSDFFPDSLWALRQKVLNRNIYWIAGMFLIAPNPVLSRSARSLKGICYWFCQSLLIFFIKRSADRVVVLCDEDKKFLASKGVNNDKILVIAGGVDDQMIEAVISTQKEFDGCFIGRFHQQKGLPELFAIWRKVCDQIPQARLAIIGWGNAWWQKKVSGYIAAYDLQANVVLFGFLDNADKYRVLKQSRVFLFPSSYESWGIVVAEALACCVPAVAFDIAAMRNFKAGLIRVAPFNVTNFAAAVLDLLGDKNTYKQYVSGAQEESRKFHWQYSAALMVSGIPSDR